MLELYSLFLFLIKNMVFLEQKAVWRNYHLCRSFCIENVWFWWVMVYDPQKSGAVSKKTQGQQFGSGYLYSYLQRGSASPPPGTGGQLR